jgi:hypothetical protein
MSTSEVSDSVCRRPSHIFPLRFPLRNGWDQKFSHKGTLKQCTDLRERKSSFGSCLEAIKHQQCVITEIAHYTARVFSPIRIPCQACASQESLRYIVWRGKVLDNSVTVISQRHALFCTRRMDAFQVVFSTALCVRKIEPSEWSGEPMWLKFWW